MNSSGVRAAGMPGTVGCSPGMVTTGIGFLAGGVAQDASIRLRQMPMSKCRKEVMYISGWVMMAGESILCGVVSVNEAGHTLCCGNTYW